MTAREPAAPSVAGTPPPPPSPSARPAIVDEFTRTRQDPSYPAYVERELAIQLARGPHAEELDKTRRWLAMQPRSGAQPESPAIRASRLRHRHPPVPKLPQQSILAHMPDRLS